MKTQWLLVFVLAWPSLAGGQPKLRLSPQTGHSKDISAVALSSDGRLAATGGEDKLVALWDLRTGKRIRTYRHRDKIRYLTFSRDDSTVVANDSANQTIGWNASSQRRGWSFGAPLGFYHGYLGLALSDDQKRYAYAIYGANDPRMAAVEHLAERRRVLLRGHPARISAVAMSPDGERVVTGTERGHLLLWDTKTGNRLRRLDEKLASFRQGASVNGLRFIRGTDLVVSTHRPSSGPSWLYVWKLDDPSYIRAVELAGRYVSALRASAKRDRLDVWVSTKANDDKRELLLHSYKLSSLEARIPEGARGDQLRRRWLVRRVAETFDDTEMAFAEDAPVTALVVEDRTFIYDVDSGELLLDLGVRRETKVSQTAAVALSPTGDVALIARGGAIDRLDLATMQISRFADKSAGQLAWCRDGTVAVAGAKLELLRGGRVVRSIEASKVSALEFSPDCKKLVTGEGFDLSQTTATVRVRDVGSGAVLQERQLRAQFFIESFGKLMLRRVRSDRYELFDSAEQRIGVFESDLDRVGAVATLTGGTLEARRQSRKTILVGEPSSSPMRLTGWEPAAAVGLTSAGDLLAHGTSKTLSRWSAAGSASERTAGPGPSMTFAPRATRAIAVKDDALVLWEIASGAVVARHADHSARVLDVAVSADGKRALSTAEDGTLVLWDLANNNRVSIALLGGEWIAYNPEGYFTSSASGVDLVAVVQGNRAYGIEQFASRTNRPDLILERMGLGSPAQIRALKHAVERRAKKLGEPLTGTPKTLEAPEVEIVSSRRDGKRARLSIEVRSAQPLRSYMVYVNGTPTLAEPAVLSGRRATARPTVELVGGANRIEVSAIDATGAESARASRVIRYNERTARDLYFVGFGVSRYADPDLALELAHKDANDLARAFWAQRGAGYRNAYVTTFENEEVDADAFDEARRFLSHARVDDTVVLFIAGHGVLDVDSGQYFYLTHKSRLDALAKTAVSFERVETLLYKTRARTKLFLMDTCDSGELDEAAATAVLARAKKRGHRSRSVRRIRRMTGRGAPRALRSDRERFLFRDVLRRSGAVVMSSSRGGEYSYESADLGNGLFTYEVIRALTTGAADADADGRVSRGELQRYVSAAVARRSGNLQHPTVDRDNLHADLAFSIVEVPPVTPMAGSGSLGPRRRTGCCDVGGSPSGPAVLALLVLLMCRRRGTRR